MGPRYPAERITRSVDSTSRATVPVDTNTRRRWVKLWLPISWPEATSVRKRQLVLLGGRADRRRTSPSPDTCPDRRARVATYAAVRPVVEGQRDDLLVSLHAGDLMPEELHRARVHEPIGAEGDECRRDEQHDAEAHDSSPGRPRPPDERAPERETHERQHDDEREGGDDVQIHRRPARVRPRPAATHRPSTLASTRSKRSSASSITSSVSAIEVYMREPASVIMPLAV